MWIDPTTQQVYYSLGQVRAACPHVSFPTTMTDDVAAAVGLQPVVVAERPACPTTHTLTADVPALQDGVWVQGWTVTPRDIDEVRAELHARRRERRAMAETAGFAYRDRRIDSDRDAVQRIAQAAGVATQSLMLFGAPFAVMWTCADDTELSLDAAGMLGLQAALADHGAACHARSRGLRERIDDPAATLEELAAVADEMDAGWPEVAST